MLPVLTFALWGRFIALSSYSTMMYLAAIITVVTALVVAARRGLPLKRVGVCLLSMALAVPVGARLLNVAIYSSGEVSLSDQLFALDFRSFSLYGGLLAAAGVGLVSCRLLAIDVTRLADSVAPALGIGIALMRAGCFLAGCCFGKEADLPWSVVYPFGSNAHVHQIFSGVALFTGGPLPVHPTQLYEMAAALVGAALAGWMLHRKVVDGTAFLIFTTWFSAFRGVNYYLVAQPTPLSVPDWFYPVLYFGIITLCLWLLVWRHPLPPRLTSLTNRQVWPAECDAVASSTPLKRV
ncbi:MAG: prolipoprotein diacylglyceryl transferase [Chloroflexi bacterium]|nr:prolipoprotein diacylglyceryl transferase [Chloroflexota bacterium]